MGLDISVYTHVKAYAPFTSWDETGEDDLYAFAVTPAPRPPIQYRLKGSGITPGYLYTGQEVMDFRAGSYSGYGEWRDWLSLNALGIPSPLVWSMPGLKGPFVELINFSDCEGVIAGDAAHKLANDFDEYPQRAEAWHDPTGEGWYFTKYRQWRQAFWIATYEYGAVVFH